MESPTKATTLKKFLGKEYQVSASFGHVRDLPKSKLGVDTEHDFEPSYIIPVKAKKTISTLKKEMGRADSVILATDADREGESIAWHLAQALQLGNFQFPISPPSGDLPQGDNFQTNPKSQNSKPYQRIVFHEITERAIKDALNNPRKIDMDLVDAQQARRVLDRLVGIQTLPLSLEKGCTKTFRWKSAVGSRATRG